MEVGEEEQYDIYIYLTGPDHEQAGQLSVPCPNPNLTI